MAKAIPKSKAQQPKPKTGQKRKWDATKALAEYLSDSNLSYADIAKKYGVSHDTVEKEGSKSDWVERRRKAGELAILDAEAAKRQKIADHIETYERIFINLRNIANNAMVRINKEAGTTKIPDVLALVHSTTVLIRAFENERRLLGLPTRDIAITGKDGENMWGGFLDMVKEAREVLHDDKPTSAT